MIMLIIIIIIIIIPSSVLVCFRQHKQQLQQLQHRMLVIMVRLNDAHEKTTSNAERLVLFEQITT